MNNRNVAIICRYRTKHAGAKILSPRGLVELAGHYRNYYLNSNITCNHSINKIKSRIYNNIINPEWIGHHRFGLFDLLNYVINNNRYVYDPASKPQFFNPVGFPTITSIHIYEYLIKQGFDAQNFDNIAGNKNKLLQFIKNKPLAVVISTTYFSMVEEISSIIKLIRSVDIEVAIILGGMFLLTHIDENNRLSKEWESIITGNVYCIIEEYGLGTLQKLLTVISEKKDIGSVKNVAYDSIGEISYTGFEPESYDFNFTFPQWEHPDVLNETGGVAFVRASQGCPFRCKFCTFPRATVKYKQRDVESLKKELRSIHRAGIRNFAFTDDNFAVTPKRIDEVCSMMIKEKFEFKWFAGIRANAITESNAQMLRDAGCKVMCMGLESGDDRMLTLMDKRTDATNNMKCLEILDRNDILVYGSFLLGFPGETDESILKTIRWINDSPLKLYKVFMFYLLPGSIIYDEQKLYELGYIGDRPSYNLWKTPDMDALKASEMLRYFILNVERAALIYSYSPMYAFFPFFLKNYSLQEGLQFFKIRTEIIKNEYNNKSPLQRIRFRKKKFQEIKLLLGDRYNNFWQR